MRILCIILTEDFEVERHHILIPHAFVIFEEVFRRFQDIAPFTVTSISVYIREGGGGTPTTTTFNARSATTEYGNFLLGTVTATAPTGFVTGFTGGRPAGIPAALAATSGLFVLQPNGSGGVTFGTATPSRAGVTRDFYWNNNAYRVIQPKVRRTSVFAAAEYDLSDRLTAFVDASLYQSQGVTYREPDGITQSTDGFIIVPVTNPWNPFGNRFWSPTGAPNTDGTPRLTGTPQATTLVSVLLKDLGGESVEVNSGVYRGVAGLRGKILNDWTWESAALYTRAYTGDVSNNAARESLFQKALLRTDTTAFNPFGYTFKVAGNAIVPDQPYTNPQSVLDTFVQKWRHDGFSAITSFDARASGPIFRYWGNTVSLATGAEYRHEQYLDLRPAYVGSNPPGVGLAENDNDYLVASYAPNSTGNRIVYSGYVETIIPVFSPQRKIPLLYSLELTGSARYENYSDFGTTTRPKAGLNWKPYDGLMVRASFNEGFSAPNLPTLYAPTRFIVDSAPQPMLTVPSPAGNIHPYPGTGVPCSSRKLKHASRWRSAWRGVGAYARMASPKVSSGSRTAPSIFAAAP